jgi:hypothetical protein
MSTTITPTEQTIDINVTEDIIDINVTNNIVDVNATTEQINIEVAGAYPLPSTVSSVFGRTGSIVATIGDYTTTQVTEGTNLYYTDTRARASNSFVAGSGAYNSTTGVITIPTNNNQITNGAGYITSSALSTYVPYTGATTNLNLGTNNLSANNAFLGFSSIAASGTQLVLTIASAPTYIVTGSGGQTIKLPDATTLPNGANYVFNNNQSSGAILVNNNSNTLVVSIPSGGYCTLELTDNSIAAGSWDRHFEAPSNVNWSTNTLDYAGSITNATWNGNAVAVNRGGTGQSTYTDGQLLIGNTIGNTLTKATLSAGTGIAITNGGGSISIASTITQYTDALARASISLTTTGTSGAATYNSTTGVLNIPQYSGGGGSMVYPAAGIAVSTGTAWGTSITNNSTDWNTAYTNRITSLTTTGSSGAATLTSNTLNIPNYTLAGLGGISLTSLSATTPLNYNNTTGVFTITQASASANGFLASGDFNTFNGKANALSGTINTIAYWDSASSIASLAVATYPSLTELSYVKGVTSAIQTQLNGKQGSLTLTTTGTSGAATLVGNTLNIPQYTGGGGGGMSIGGTITSATAGSILFAGTSGVLAQNNANFFWDDTNIRLGIGSTTLGSSLQINGNSAIGYSASTAAPTNGLAVSGNVTIGTTTIANATTDILTISKNFNDTTKLIISNTTSGTNANPRLSLISNTTAGYVEMGKNSAGAGGYKTLVANAAFIYNATAGNITILNDSSTGNINFAAGGSSTSTFILNSSNNLGLNTSTIGSRLQVNGNAAIGYSASTAAPTNGLAVSGQVGVGINSPVTTAALQVSSTTQGFLPPVMTTTQKNAITSPATGLVVFDSTLGKLCVFSGTWQTITSV